MVTESSSLARLTALASVIAVAASACGSQERAKTVRSGPVISPRPITAGASISLRDCKAWLGPNAAILCNPNEMQTGYPFGAPTRMWKRLKLSTPGNHGHSGVGRGVAQVSLEHGWPFEPGGTLVIQGRVPEGTILIVAGRDRSHGHRHWWVGQALFSEIGLERGGRAVLSVSVDSNGLVYTLDSPLGNNREPDVVWFRRY